MSKSLTLNKSDFINALKSVFVVTPKNDVRLYMNGVFFEFGSEGLRLVGTDGHRVVFAELTSGGALVDTSFIVDYNSIEQIVKSVKPARKGSPVEKSEEVTLVVQRDEDATNVTLDVGGMSFELKLIDGSYPDCRRITSKTNFEAVEAIGYSMGYLSDIKKAFNHLVLNKNFDGCKLEFNGSSDVTKITMGSIYSVCHLVNVEMWLMPIRL